MMKRVEENEQKSRILKAQLSRAPSVSQEESSDVLRFQRVIAHIILLHSRAVPRENKISSSREFFFSSGDASRAAVYRAERERWCSINADYRVFFSSLFVFKGLMRCVRNWLSKCWFTTELLIPYLVKIMVDWDSRKKWGKISRE